MPGVLGFGTNRSTPKPFPGRGGCTVAGRRRGRWPSDGSAVEDWRGILFRAVIRKFASRAVRMLSVGARENRHRPHERGNSSDGWRCCFRLPLTCLGGQSKPHIMASNGLHLDKTCCSHPDRKLGGGAPVPVDRNHNPGRASRPPQHDIDFVAGKRPIRSQRRCLR